MSQTLLQKLFDAALGYGLALSAFFLGAVLSYCALEGAHLLPQLVLRAGVEYTAAQAVVLLTFGEFFLVVGMAMFLATLKDWRRW